MCSPFAPRIFAVLGLVLTFAWAGVAEVNAQNRGLQFVPIKNLEGGGWENGIISTPPQSTSTVWPVVGRNNGANGKGPYQFPKGTVFPKPPHGGPTGPSVVLNKPVGPAWPPPGAQGKQNPSYVGPGTDVNVNVNPILNNVWPNPAIDVNPPPSTVWPTVNPSIYTNDPPSSMPDPSAFPSMPAGDPPVGDNPSSDPTQAGFLWVVVINQTGNTIAVAGKFIDPGSGQWIVTFNNAVAPGQRVRLGYTNNATIYLHAEITSTSGEIVTLIDGTDTTFDTPRGALGMVQGNFSQEGTELVTNIVTQ